MKTINTKPYWVCALKCDICGEQWEEEIPVGYAVKHININDCGHVITKDDIFIGSVIGSDKKIPTVLVGGGGITLLTCPNCQCTSSIRNISSVD